MNKMDRYTRDKDAFEEFKISLNRIKTFPEAQLLVINAPPVNSPGRRYYSNFGFFIQGFDIPDSVSDEELILYKSFIKKLDETGQLKTGEGKRIIDKLNNAINNRNL